MSKKKIQVFEYEGKRITFDFGDGSEMVNATQMIKAFPNKKMNNFLRTSQTKEYIKIYSQSAKKRHGNDYEVLRVVRGGNDASLRGTWMDQRLALKFSAWLSPYFEDWVYNVITELLTTGSVTLSDNEMIVNKKNYYFMLNKIFDDSLQINRMSKQLLNPDDESE